MRTIGLKNPPKTAPKQKKKDEDKGKQKDNVQLSPDAANAEGQDGKADGAE